MSDRKPGDCPHDSDPNWCLACLHAKIGRLLVENERLRQIARHAVVALETLYCQEKIKPFTEHSPALKAVIAKAVQGMRECVREIP